MRALWLPALAAFSLTAACATVETPSQPTPVAAVKPSAPQPVAGYDWHFNTSGGAAQLAYGVEQSDDLKLGFHCDAGSGQLEMTAIAPSGTRTIYLESGGDTETLTLVEVGCDQVVATFVPSFNAKTQGQASFEGITTWTGTRVG